MKNLLEKIKVRSDIKSNVRSMSTWVKIRDNYYEQTITGAGKETTIWVSEEQMKVVAQWEGQGYALKVKNQIQVDTWYPALIKYGKKGETKHLGVVLFPESGRSWSGRSVRGGSVFKDKVWDFTPGNVLVAQSGQFHCKRCQEWKPMIELIKDSSQTCKRCEYLRTLIAKAEVRAKAKGLPATISLDTFKGVNNCQLTGIPLIFESVNSLTKASLDRLNSNEGYTVENTVLRCIGINFAKGNMSEEEFLEFLHKVGRGEKRSLATWKVGPVEAEKIRLMLYHVKSRTPDSSLTKACLEELIRQTEGVCGITGIALDMSMKGHSAPSLDRIDVKGGYEKENVWIVSFIGNRMKSVCSVKEAQEFIVEVVRICREKKLIV